MEETPHQLARIRWHLTGIVTVGIWSMLVWQYFHTGVPAHHFMQRADLPAMSNWWGGLLLPALTWYLLGRTQTRLLKDQTPEHTPIPTSLLVGFGASIIFGAAISISFVTGHSEVPPVLMLGVFVCAPFFCAYKAEMFLGVVLSMSVLFGAVLSTMFSVVVASTAFILHMGPRFIWSLVKK